MITILITIAAAIWIILMTIQKYGGELIISPVIGFMVGWLYNPEHFEKETEHTIQIVLGIVSFTIIWNTYE